MQGGFRYKSNRLLIVNFELEGFILTCVNVYAPNEISRKNIICIFKIHDPTQM